MIRITALFLLCATVANAAIFRDRFNEQYNKIKNLSNGYFSKDGVPYHSVETLIVEAPDYGHETTSEALSYYVWLEAMNGAINGDFTGVNTAWDILEKTLIPILQSSRSKYDPNNPGTGYGKDPIGQELTDSYDTKDLYLMHWLADLDNRYGFGNLNGQCELGPKAEGPSLIANGPGTVLQGIISATCDNFTYGSKTNGFAWNSNVPKWTYGLAPDADARAIQAAFWASQWATAQGKLPTIKGTLEKAAKMGDYLRYSLFDAQFKKVGNCTKANNCPPGEGKDSAHYLLSQYVTWGGSLDPQGFAYLSGASSSIIGYQNPMTAYALINDPNLKPKSASAVEDWKKSLKQQLALYQYLQSVEGAFVGGVTNSYNGNYDTPPAEIAEHTFDGMYYVDAGSSVWYGFNSWTADRLAQYYYVTGDEIAGTVMKKWVSWVANYIKYGQNTFHVPQSLSLSGSPPNLHASVTSTGTSISLVVTTARAMIYYAAKSGDNNAKVIAKNLLDYCYHLFTDEKGISYAEMRADYYFNTTVNIPQPGWTGTYPNGDQINASSTFISIRSWYKEDPEWYKVDEYINKGGEAPVFYYHRFFDQCDYALALGAYTLLFESNTNIPS